MFISLVALHSVQSACKRVVIPPRHRVPQVHFAIRNLQFAFCILQSLVLSAVVAADERDWDYRAYDIQAIVAIDVPGGLAEQLTDRLPTYLRRRADAAMGPLWSFDVQLAAGAVRQHIFSQREMWSDAPTADLPFEGDKLVLAAMRWQPDGFVLTAREFDRYTQRWGTPIRRDCRQEQGLPEQLFALVWQAVAPLARLELVPNDEGRVVLTPWGAALHRANPGNQWAAPGDVFLPILRRTGRGGELVENGIQAVPWTYVEVVDHDGEKAVGRIHSGTRMPLGARRQGRVEQIAIAIRADPADTVLRLRSRTDPDKPLVGYAIYAQQAGDESLARIGSTDREGKISVPPDENRVRMLYLKNGGQLLARLPLVPGSEPQVEVPLPDDDQRLAAETRLASLREDLIDVVARRNILMARVRQKIKKGDFAAAQELINAINELPDRSQFNLTLTTAARLVRSDDPQIQRRIDQLFEATQTALSQYLDVRPINELHNELRAAQRKGS